MTAPADASARYRAAARALEPVETTLVAVEITHPDLPAPIRAVNDTRGWTIQGASYQPLRFGARLVRDAEGRPGAAEIAMDNIGSILTQWIEAARGGVGATIRVLEILVSAADDPAADREPEWEVAADVHSTQVTRDQVRVRLGYDRRLSASAVHERYGAENAPGLS